MEETSEEREGTNRGGKGIKGMKRREGFRRLVDHCGSMYYPGKRGCPTAGHLFLRSRAFNNTRILERVAEHVATGKSTRSWVSTTSRYTIPFGGQPATSVAAEEPPLAEENSHHPRRIRRRHCCSCRRTTHQTPRSRSSSLPRRNRKKECRSPNGTRRLPTV